jgi:uridine kinase
MSDVFRETRRLPFPPVMLAVAGASGSGKTTLAAELARTLGGLHFSLDTYYRDLSHLPLEQRALQNFDDPAMIEAQLLANHLAELAEGHAIERPVYSFSEYIRVCGETEKIRPGAVVVVEGLFTLYFPELRPFYQFSVYVDTPDDVCFARRLKRDIEERGREPGSVRRQYDATVRPCGLAFVRPLIDFADLVLDGSDPLDFKVELVINAMRKRGLLGNLGTGLPGTSPDSSTASGIGLEK